MIDESSRYIFPAVNLPKNTEKLEQELTELLKKSVQTAYSCQVMLAGVRYIDYTPTLTRKIKELCDYLKLGDK